MTYTIDTFTVSGLTINIVPDDHPMSPRDWDNLGLMLCNYKGYDLGDEQIEPEDHESLEALLEWLKDTYDPTVILPLYVYEHSGITIRAGSGENLEAAESGRRTAFPMDYGGWDTSLVGFILDTAESRKSLGADLEFIERILRAEVEQYATYLEGGIVGFVIEDPDGNHLDSCFGFYTTEDAESEARASARYAAEAYWNRVTEDDSVRLRAARNPTNHRSPIIPRDAAVTRTEDGYWVEARVFVPKQ